MVGEKIVIAQACIGPIVCLKLTHRFPACLDITGSGCNQIAAKKDEVRGQAINLLNKGRQLRPICPSVDLNVGNLSYAKSVERFGQVLNLYFDHSGAHGESIAVNPGNNVNRSSANDKQYDPS